MGRSTTLLSIGITLAVVFFHAESSVADAKARWGSAVLRQGPEWYASAEARAMADAVIQYQSPHGGWPKNTDLGEPPASAEALARLNKSGVADTIDNGATILPMRFLARVAAGSGDERCRAAVVRGVDYLLASQYPNGGFPQFYPLRDHGYYSHITYNDGAMINALDVLRDVAEGEQPFAFIDANRRARAADAVRRGIDCILKTQIRQNGKLTAWCAQHDEKTLEPTWARTYEPPSLSGAESVGVVRFLMEIEKPGPEVVAAIEGAVAWFRAVAIPGVRLEDFTAADGKKDRRLVADPAAEPLWARFYELGTNRPVFLGRDSVVHYAIAEIEPERRNGYSYYGSSPAPLLARDYPRWRAKQVASGSLE